MGTKELTVYRGGSRNYDPIPKIILQGYWLGELGSSIGSKIAVKKLSEVDRRLKYFSRLVQEVSRLHKNRSGRYETSNGHCYTSGQRIEALVPEAVRVREGV